MATVGNKTLSYTAQSSPPLIDKNFLNSQRPAGVQSLPLANWSSFVYQGACKLNNADVGTSGLRNNTSAIAVDVPNSRVFAISHSWEYHLGAFALPTLSTSTDYNALPVGANTQPFFNHKTKPPVALSGTSTVDIPTYLALVNGELVCNMAPYYTGAGVSPETTFVLQNPNDLANSAAKGWHKLDVAEKGSQWITPIPTEWQTLLGGDTLWGASNAKLAINSRLTMGVSAYAVSSASFTGAVADSVTIPTTQLMGHTLDKQMHYDRLSQERLNDLWGEFGGAHSGFIIPGTRTYCVIGTHGGEKGTQYKLADDVGTVSGGYAPRFIGDNYYKYWLFDLNDLIAAKNGQRAKHDVLPYSYGKFSHPFQYLTNSSLDADGFSSVGGMSWDMNTKTFYMFMRYNDNNVLCAWRYV